jgi:alpha-mannosidase
MPEPIPAALETTLERLRGQTELNWQTRWRSWLGEADVERVQSFASSRWQAHPLNGKGHLAWGRGRRSLWLQSQLVWPERLDQFPLRGMEARLALTWWAEQATLYVNGQPVQSGDLFDCSTRTCLTTAVEPGESLELLLHLVSPAHDAGALVSSRLLFEAPQAACPEPSFVATEVEAVARTLQSLAPQELPALVAALQALDGAQLGNRPQAEAKLQHLRDRLSRWSPLMQAHRVSLLGHAHLDLAWLWPVAETWDAAERTFESVLQLHAEFPELTFGHSTPALYAWVERHRPQLFERIRRAIAQGWWEVTAGMWVEPELNLISAESLVRQLLYGQQYCQEHLGVANHLAWLPDSFGFGRELPKLLRQAGIDTIVTQKLRWNDTTQFPHGLCHWRAQDGSEVLALMSAPIGTDADPLKLLDYALAWEQQTGLQESLWLPGVGDHGGGPTRAMLEQIRRWQQSPLFPELRFTTASAYLQQVRNKADWPVWDDELYLEFHRGCYTSHADQKAWNRRCERLLYAAELTASLTAMVTGSTAAHPRLAAAWEQVLFNQFHDILPGSSIPEVYAAANPHWRAAAETAAAVQRQAIARLSAQIIRQPPHPQAHPWLIFNVLPWPRGQIVTLPGVIGNGRVLDWQGQDLTLQASPEGVHVQLPRIPGIGYALIWWVPGPPPPAAVTGLRWSSSATGFGLENDFLQAQIDPQKGELTRLWDKQHQRELLSAPGNRIERFRDQGQYWDAWNIDPQFEQHALATPTLHGLRWIERGPLRLRLRRVVRFGHSWLQQDYVLDADAAELRIESHCDWQEEHQLLKVAFPLSVEATTYSTEAPGGVVQRPTHPQTEAEGAKWEVPFLQWVDLSDELGGLSLLTREKQGCDVKGNRLRLTLLRGSTWPDPEADKGAQQFTYALYPHQQGWQQGNTPQAAIAFNHPLTVWSLAEAAPAASLPPAATLLSWQPTTLLPMALKPLESGQGWLLRLVETIGQASRIDLKSDWGLAIQTPMTLLETLPDRDQVSSAGKTELSTEEQDATSTSGTNDCGALCNIAPWQVVSYRLGSQAPPPGTPQPEFPLEEQPGS